MLIDGSRDIEKPNIPVVYRKRIMFIKSGGLNQVPPKHLIESIRTVIAIPLINIPG